MKRTRLSLAVAILLLVFASSAAAASLYVRANGTEMKEKPGPGGAPITKLDIGTKVEVLAKEGAWVKVSVKTADKKEKTGYVFAQKLSEDKPDKERFGGTVTASASEGDSALALRGLSATSEKYAERQSIKPGDIAAVKEMEKRKADPAAMDKFLREGKLGEYAQ